MATTVTINGSVIDLAANRVQLHRLEKGLDEAGVFTFSQYGQLPGVTTWFHGQMVEVQVDGRTIPDLKGKIVGIGQGIDPRKGWVWAYTVLDLRHFANKLFFTSPTFSGTLTYNRTPTDPLYNVTEAGLSIGDMLTRVLDLHQDALNAIGIGPAPGGGGGLAYLAADLAEPWADLVPTQPVPFSGRLINTLESALSEWAGTVALWIEYVEATSDWRIRLVDTADATKFPSTTITLDEDDTDWDPPSINSDSSNCYTRVAVRGHGKIEPAFLSLREGTLEKAWTDLQEDAWTWADFASPKDYFDQGDVTALTSTSATCISDNAAETWTVNQWPNTQAWVHLVNPVATGITFAEARRATSNTAMAAGGSATVNWDLDWPLDASGYSRYAIIADASGGLNEVYRLFNVVPDYVASHMDFKLAQPATWTNGSLSIVRVMYPIGSIDWLIGLSPPPVMFPVTNFEILRTTGQIRFLEPVTKFNNTQADLDLGGTHVKQVYDVRVMIPYAKEPLESPCPDDGPPGTPQYEGTAYVLANIADTFYEDIESWIDPRNTSSMRDLACMRLKTVQNIVYDGTVSHHGKYLPALTMGMALNFTGNGYTTGWEDINCPVRKVALNWGEAEQPDVWMTTLAFNNRRNPVTGENYYLHPAFAGGTFGYEGGGNFMGGGFDPGMTGGGLNLRGAMQQGMEGVIGPDMSQQGVEAAMSLPFTSGTRAPERTGIPNPAETGYDITPSPAERLSGMNFALGEGRTPEGLSPSPAQELRTAQPTPTPAERLADPLLRPAGPQEAMRAPLPTVSVPSVLGTSSIMAGAGPNPPVLAGDADLDFLKKRPPTEDEIGGGG
jgi:hypothetical protein